MTKFVLGHLSLVACRLQILGPVLHETCVYLVMVGLLVTRRFDWNVVEAVNRRARTRQENRRVGGDDELSVTCAARLGHNFEQFELALGRKRRLRFVQQVQPPDLITRSKERHERLAVRERRQRPATKVFELARVSGGPFVQNLGKVLKDSRAKERAGHAAVGPFDGDTVVQLVLVGIGGRARGFLVAPDVDVATVRQRFEQCGLARAIFADEQRHGRIEGDAPGLAQDRQVEGIVFLRRIFLWIECHALQMHGQPLNLQMIRLTSAYLEPLG